MPLLRSSSLEMTRPLSWNGCCTFSFSANIGGSRPLSDLAVAFCLASGSRLSTSSRGRLRSSLGLASVTSSTGVSAGVPFALPLDLTTGAAGAGVCGAGLAAELSATTGLVATGGGNSLRGPAGSTWVTGFGLAGSFGGPAGLSPLSQAASRSARQRVVIREIMASIL